MESDMDDFVWLEKPLHKNVFPKDFFEKNKQTLDDVTLSFDGSIMAVRRSKIEHHYKEQGVDMMHLGYKPYPKKIKVEDEEGFYKTLSMYVDLQ